MKNYFKKFSIMFVMAFAIMLGCCTSVFAADDTGVIGTTNLNNTVENSAKVGEQLIAPEKSWKRYENTCSKISYLGTGWNLYQYNTESGGNTSCTWTSDKASVKFNFTGNKIRIINPYNTPHNNSIEVYIDGIKVNTHSVAYSNLRSVIVYENKNLSNVEHNFEYKFVGTGEAVFDAVDIDSIGQLKPYNANISSISLNKSTDNLQVGQTDNLVATTTPAAVGVKWTTSNPSIATVDQNGKVTAIKEGQATITATTNDGSNLSDSCTVNVTKKIEPIDPNNPGTDETTNIVNIAHAKGDNTNNAGGDVTIIFHGTADTTLNVVKTADVKDVWVGDNFTYTIVVTNTGTKTAKAVIVNDQAPNHIDFVVNGITTTQGKVDPSSTSKNVIVNVGDIPPLGTVTIKIPATVIL